MASRVSWLIVCVLLWAACGASEPTGRPVVDATSEPAQQGEIMTGTTSTAGLPEDLQSAQPLWEVVQTATTNRSETQTRLYADGRMFSWSNTRRTRENGQMRRLPAPYAWRLDVLISQEGVDQVRELIKTDFSQVESAQSSPGQDQGLVSWRSHVEGTTHSVTLPATASDKLPQAIRDIDYAIQSHIVPGGAPIEQE